MSSPFIKSDVVTMAFSVNLYVRQKWPYKVLICRSRAGIFDFVVVWRTNAKNIRVIYFVSHKISNNHH
jgi:hypothetical protein